VVRWLVLPLLLAVLGSCAGPGANVARQYAEAKVLYAEGKIDEAARALEAVLARSGSFAPARLLYGRALYFRQDYGRAEAVLAALHGDQPSSVEAALWLVRSLVQQGKTAEAETRLTRLLAVNPDDPRLAYQMALLREEHNDLTGALGFLRSAAGADEDLALVHYEAARVAFQLNDAPSAQAELARAVAFLSPTSLLRQPLERLAGELALLGAPR